MDKLQGKEKEGDKEQDKQKEKEKDPEEIASITYKLTDILDFIDNVYDLGVMCYNDDQNGFNPHGKPWFKAKVHAYMRRLSTAGQIA